MSDDMNPPTKEKTPAKKAAKEKASDGGEAKTRAPRQDYGYRVGATLHITDKETKYNGQRQAWFESLQKFDGKVVQEWEESMKGTENNKGKPQSPRGWLRFYVLDGSVELKGGEEPKAKAPAKEEAAA